jgi:hypothetical protein
MPSDGDVVKVEPLLSESNWGWFCLDNVLYHGRIITILCDKTGSKYRKDKGLRVYADGVQIARSDTLGPMAGDLPGNVDKN